MSLDAKYLLHYEVQSYTSPTPMDRDEYWLKEKFGGDFVRLNSGFDIYWDKPKYTLPDEDMKMLMADQILELLDGGFWVNKKTLN